MGRQANRIRTRKEVDYITDGWTIRQHRRIWQMHEETFPDHVY